MTARLIGLVLVSFLIVGCATRSSSAKKTFSFAVICDTRSDAVSSGSNGVNVAAAEAICRELSRKGAEFVIAPGDFICGNVNWYSNVPPNVIQYSTFLKAAEAGGVTLPGGRGLPLYAVRGNHEAYHQIAPEADVDTAWLTCIGNRLPTNGPQGEVGYSYSFTWGNSLFIATDHFIHASSNENSNLYVNQAWVDKVLVEHPEATHVFLYGHTPVFSAQHADCLEEKPAQRDALLRSISPRSGVYLCGHDHFYARGKIPVYAEDGKTPKSWMQQVITPSGAPFLGSERSPKWDGKYTNSVVVSECYLDNTMGYQLVKVRGNEVKVEFFATTNGAAWRIVGKRKDGHGDVYEYKYDNDWRNWKFERMDGFSYALP